MNEHANYKDGYIVFEDSGTSPIAYGACKKWFPTYDEAINYAIDIVKKMTEDFKEHVDYNSVIVYEGSENLMNESHSCPCGRVVFDWRTQFRILSLWLSSITFLSYSIPSSSESCRS